jgi:hypothetical protein
MSVKLPADWLEIFGPDLEAGINLAERVCAYLERPESTTAAKDAWPLALRSIVVAQLHLRDGYTFVEVAERLGISDRTAKSDEQRVRDALAGAVRTAERRWSCSGCSAHAQSERVPQGWDEHGHFVRCPNCARTRRGLPDRSREATEIARPPVSLLGHRPRIAGAA